MSEAKSVATPDDEIAAREWRERLCVSYAWRNWQSAAPDDVRAPCAPCEYCGGCKAAPIVVATLARWSKERDEQAEKDADAHEAWLHAQLDRLGVRRSRYGLSNACDGALARIEDGIDTAVKRLAAAEARADRLAAVVCSILDDPGGLGLHTDEPDCLLCEVRQALLAAVAN